jgi:uncharacterized protein YbjQ (UPF0145 family)
MILSNTETVPGYTIVEFKGLVSGNMVQSKHILKDIVAVLKSIIGGEIKDYTSMLEGARNLAQNRMLGEATQLGANAVVNIRFTTSAIMRGMSEILAYGTAVIVKKN